MRLACALTLQLRTIEALTTSLPTIVVDLELRAKTAVGITVNLLTPSNNLLRKTFMQKFDGYPKKFKAFVNRFEASPDGVSASDRFILRYKDGSELSICKAELIDKLTTDTENERLSGDSRWVLRSKIVSWRWVAFSFFMQDVHDNLAILSKSFQSNKLVINGIAKNVNKTLKELKKLKDTPGPKEATFWKEVKKDEGADMLNGKCQLEDGTEGRILFKEDRKQVLLALENHLVQRYSAILDDPVLDALNTFNHRVWPQASLLDGIYDDNIETLYTAFKRFFEPHETLEKVIEQWNEMALEIIDHVGLMSLKHHDLWARMLVHQHDEYSLALRLVAISLILPADTSECERIFSLMNDIKTAERSRMATNNLKNLMLWHRMARKLAEDGSLSAQHLSCYDVPVMEIVERFRAMGASGVRGRSAHRAWPIPTYAYQTGLTKEAKGALGQAQAHTLAVGSSVVAAAEEGSSSALGSSATGVGSSVAMGGGRGGSGDEIQDEDGGRGGGDYHARWGEPGPSSGLGEHAGQHLPRRSVVGGAPVQ